jgi:hypothetical protein
MHTIAHFWKMHTTALLCTMLQGMHDVGLKGLAVKYRDRLMGQGLGSLSAGDTHHWWHVDGKVSSQSDRGGRRGRLNGVGTSVTDVHGGWV